MDLIQFRLSLDCLCSYETSPSLKPQLDWIGLGSFESSFFWIAVESQLNLIETGLDPIRI